MYHIKSLELSRDNTLSLCIIEFKESGSGYYINGRVVYDVFVFDKKKSAVFSALLLFFI
nr:MAG TPA: hypothetical protein [Caudoviricetes sp.]